MYRSPCTSLIGVIIMSKILVSSINHLKNGGFLTYDKLESEGSYRVDRIAYFTDDGGNPNFDLIMVDVTTDIYYTMQCNDFANALISGQPNRRVHNLMDPDSDFEVPEIITVVEVTPEGFVLFSDTWKK